MTTTYDRTKQARESLSKANLYRFAVAAERRKIAEMDRAEAAAYLADLIETTEDPAIESAQVRRLLEAIPRRGPLWIDRTFNALGIRTATRRLREMTPRQRKEMADHVRRTA